MDPSQNFPYLMVSVLGVIQREILIAKIGNSVLQRVHYFCKYCSINYPTVTDQDFLGFSCLYMFNLA